MSPNATCEDKLVFFLSFAGGGSGSSSGGSRAEAVFSRGGQFGGLCA